MYMYAYTKPTKMKMMCDFEAPEWMVRHMKPRSLQAHLTELDLRLTLTESTRLCRGEK